MDLIFADKPSGVTTHTSHGSRPRSALIDVNDGFAEHLAERLTEHLASHLASHLADRWRARLENRSGAPSAGPAEAGATADRAEAPPAEKLFVAHRLDRETTGAICFARSAETAELLRAAFANRDVKKRYLFLTDRIAMGHAAGPPADTFDVESFIERRGSTIVSEKPSAGRAANARTRLRKLDESDGLALWEALPETGKSHQIRLHARASGLSILGDTLHGGSAFPQLCLHSEHLVFNLAGQDFIYASPPPRWFLKRELARDPLLARWLSAVDRRERLLRTWAAIGAPQLATSSERTWRWIHHEGDPLRAEQLGPVHSLSWFSDRAPTAVEMASIERLSTELQWSTWQLKVRRDRGSGSGVSEPRTSAGAPKVKEETLTGGLPPPARWMARENGLAFEFRTDQGLSPGLFLDQRRNRSWVRAHASGKRVLNLFCYTGGFSVAAASGGATHVVSVDLSRPFLDWSKTNFALNGLSTEGHEFRAMDSREYLGWARKKGLRFDLVICDPPSFSRSEKGVFKIESDIAELVRSLTAVTEPGGTVLFATNYERWTEAQLETKLLEALPRARLEATPSPDWDFELPNESRNMKSVLIRVP